MNIFSTFVKYLISTTYLGVFFLRVFHYGFIFRKPLAIITGCVPTLLIAAVLIVIVSYFEYKIISPFERTINKAIKSRRNLTESETQKCLKAYKKFDIAIAIAEGMGFLVGASGTFIIESLTGALKFDALLFAIIVAQSVGCGYICYTIIIFRIKKVIMVDALRKTGVSIDTDLPKTLSIAITSCLYMAIMNMVTIPIGLFLENTVNGFHTFLLDSLIGGSLTAAVCFADYFLLVKKIKETEKYVSSKLYTETLNLAESAKESAATSIEQSASVKEIVATVEETNSLSANINDKVQNVTQITEHAKDEILSGVEYLEQNIQELVAIMETNKDTMKGIKDLDDKITNVWEVVTMINEVASQAKIIAFNAELEASNAGEYGQNFHIVASEVRRLSENIIDDTKEIKDKIGEIQNASDSLVDITRQSAGRINSGYENIRSLKDRFSNIKESAETIAKSSNDITEFFIQLAASNEQIYTTIKQIADGIENFTQTTESVSAISQNVKDLAGLL